MGVLEEELQSLRSEVLMLNSDLLLRKELSSELEDKLVQLELNLQATEAKDASTTGKLALILKESRGFEQQVAWQENTSGAFTQAKTKLVFAPPMPPLKKCPFASRCASCQRRGRR